MDEDDHAAFRYVEGTDPDDVANRVAFIEKTPRVRRYPYSPPHQDNSDCDNWVGNSSLGDGDECGHNQEARDWCDKELKAMGYDLAEETDL